MSPVIKIQITIGIRILFLDYGFMLNGFTQQQKNGVFFLLILGPWGGSAVCV